MLEYDIVFIRCLLPLLTRHSVTMNEFLSAAFAPTVSDECPKEDSVSSYTTC